MNSEQHALNARILKARRSNWQALIWSKNGLSPETIYNGFPKKKLVLVTPRKAARYDNIIRTRRKLLFYNRSEEADEIHYRKMLA